MTGSTCHRAAAGFLVAIYALGVENIRYFRNLLPAVVVAFPARSYPPLLSKIMVAFGTLERISGIGGMFFVIEEDLPGSALHYDSDRGFGRAFCKNGIADQAD
jgi:hypothetical protein